MNSEHALNQPRSPNDSERNASQAAAGESPDSTAIDAKDPSRHPRENRPLRVLHIGNIANNAYLIADLLNRSGYDCDVICYDYYHIMGCPQWEDADFVGPEVDEFAPNWDSVNLRGFRCPRWFAQGPLALCLIYLLARRRGNRAAVWFFWTLLTWSTRIRNNPRWQFLQPIMRLCTRTAIILIRNARSIPAHRFVYVLAVLIYRFGRTLVPIVNAMGNAANLVCGMIGKIVKKVCPTKAIQQGLYKAYKGLCRALNIIKTICENQKRKLILWLRNVFSITPDKYINDERLIRIFATIFPNRADRLCKQDIDHYRSYLPYWRKLFDHYDVIHSYATDPIWPMLADKHPYIALEHSTIRHLPFQDDAIGRLTALAYNLADSVIITNCDCYKAAEQLKVKSYRFIPHPLNEKWLSPGLGDTLRGDLRAQLDADFIVFHPPRQHWEPHRDLSRVGPSDDPSWLKGNDIFYEGLARFIKDVAPRAAVVAVEWGANVSESKALLRELGIADRVKWIAPQHSRNMLRYIDACDLVVDQFSIGAFGTTMPKGMPLGKPAMCYVDPELHSWCLPEMPPIINARTVDEVFAGLKRAYQDPQWLRELGTQGRSWYEQYHSNVVIRERLGEMYQEALASCLANTLGP